MDELKIGIIDVSSYYVMPRFYTIDLNIWVNCTR